jgi:hypothetical protein
MAKKQRTFYFYLVLFLIAFQALSGLYGGSYLLLDPTGQSLNMPLSLLKHSPFRDYFIPGLILFLVLGLFPVIVYYGLWIGNRWAWFGTLSIGIGLLIWIGVEIVMIGYQPTPPLQLVYGIVGLLILAFCFSPSFKNTLN